MWFDLIILVGLSILSVIGYKSWHILNAKIKAIYDKFDTIYYMLCDIFKKRHERQQKRGKK